MGQLSGAILQFVEAYKVKSDKISSADSAFELGVQRLPIYLKNFCASNIPSRNWAFEGSVGKGSWSRTPWLAVFDARVTERASDGFYVAIIFSEDLKSFFLVLTNTSSRHINYKPYTLGVGRIPLVPGFQAGPLVKGKISQSGKGSGPSFEASILQWRQFDTKEISNDFEPALRSLLGVYESFVGSLKDLPVEKPFRLNPFLVK